MKPTLSDGASARWRFENAPRNSSSSADTSCASRPKLTFKPYASAIARSLKPQALEPIVRRHVERRMLRVEPVAGLVERVVAHREHAMVVPRQLLLVGRREIVRGMRRPIALANDLAVEHEILLAKELEHRRDVHELDAVALGGGDHARVAGADVGAAGFGRAAELAHRVDAPADALLRLEHEHVAAAASSASAACKPREPGADDDDVASVLRQRRSAR